MRNRNKISIIFLLLILIGSFNDVQSESQVHHNLLFDVEANISIANEFPYLVARNSGHASISDLGANYVCANMTVQIFSDNEILDIGFMENKGFKHSAFISGTVTAKALITSGFHYACGFSKVESYDESGLRISEQDNVCVYY